MNELRDEFISEAQELVEALSRDLLLLEQAHKDGADAPELVNEAFRAVHTLKGIAGMFGDVRLGEVAHGLEKLLDDLRLGRQELSLALLDVLFEGVEVSQRLLAEPAGVALAEVEVAGFLDALASFGEGPAPALDELSGASIDPSVLAVLTEYEEHRLRTNVAQGVALYRLKVCLSLATVDVQLEELKRRVESTAEFITYLPSRSSGGVATIELDVLLASRATPATLEAVLGGQGARLERLSWGSRFAPAPGGPSSERLVLVPRTSRPSSAPPSSSELSVTRGDEMADPRSSVVHSVRVDIRKLDRLMNVVGELAIVRNAMMRLSERLRELPELRALAIDLHRVNRGFHRHLEDLQEGILDVRMVPLRQTFDRLARVVRQVARQHDKQVRLVVVGGETEIDKLIVEELRVSLIHLIRNAIDHGIETPSVRELAGKPGVGTLALRTRKGITSSWRSRTTGLASPRRSCSRQPSGAASWPRSTRRT